MLSHESVSVILSVQNAQNWLARDLHALTDCLAEMSMAFEVIVIDNNSHDLTIEIAEHFASLYPQVRYRRLRSNESDDAALQVGIQMAQGEYLFTANRGSRVVVADLRRLWALRSDPRLVVARSHTTARRIDAGLVSRLSQWAHRLAGQGEASEPVPESFGGIQMIRRAALDILQPEPSVGVSTNPGHIEVSHISHQQLASPKLIDARRTACGQLPSDAVTAR